MDYKELFPNWAVDWAERRLKNNNVKKADIILVRDWLNVYGEENPKIKTKIMKLRWEDAMVAQEKWHKALLDKSMKLKQHKGNPEDFTILNIENTNGKWGQIKTKEGLQFEGSVMGHCIGEGGYDEGVDNGNIKIFSLRDKDGMPHITVEYDVEENTVYQIKGRGNSFIPKKYREDVVFLLQYLKPKSIEDLGLSGYVFGSLGDECSIYKWDDMENWPKGLYIPFLDLDYFKEKKLPENCKIGTLLVVNMNNFDFPKTLEAHSIIYSNCSNFTINDNVTNLSLIDCKNIQLPDIIKNIEHISINRCSINNLPVQISVKNIEIDDVKICKTNEDVSEEMRTLSYPKLNHKI